MATYCPECNTKNPDDSKFCKECASPLMPPEEISATKTIKTPDKGFSRGIVIAGKYQILQKIGEGGMGIVYKARDSRLDRIVALKFLSSDLMKDKKAKKRFIQEAKAAATLEHPNICTVYEVDKADGKTFIAMSYIEGQSLKDQLKDGPMDVDEAIDIAVQVAEGLKEAHEKGIVHRDIKPANIMLTKKRQAKITDFGLAKLSWGVDLTKTSTIMGTVAYMSPEQAKGEEVDHRTDIWSLGAMFYEMLTGTRPFKKDQEHALIYSILNDEPIPVSVSRPKIPDHIEQVVEKALAKKMNERYQNTGELIRELKGSPSISFAKVQKSIVVLPFKNLSPDLEQEYFCDGMTEEIISDLSKIDKLKVISRSSAMTFKGTQKKIKDIAKEVDVTHVLEGSVRKAGNDLRITAQLIDAVNDDHIWSEKYSGTLDDVFDIQEKVSRAIAEALELKLSVREKRRMFGRPIQDAQAYECYVKARYEMIRWTEESLGHAFQLLQNGLEIFGENADLYGGLALAHIYSYEIGIKADGETLQKAEEYAKRVKKLRPDSHHYHYIIGRIERFQGSSVKAIRHFHKALSIDSNDPEILMFYSFLVSTFAGRPVVAEPYVKKLLEIDPLNPMSYFALAMYHCMKGEIKPSIAFWRKFSQMDPGNRVYKFFLSRYLSWDGQLKEALGLIDQEEKEKSDDWPTVLSLFSKYTLLGEKEKAMQIMTEEAKTFFWNDPDIVWFVAGYFSLIHENEKSLEWLERAIDMGWINYPLFSEIDPFLENIRGEPRFKKLMERVKHEWENFEV